MKKISVLSLLLVVLFWTLPAAAFTPRLDFNFYMDNLEHFNRFREGYSLFGTSGAAYIWHDIGPLHIEAGFYLRTEFGSEKIVDQLAPWMRIEAKKGPWFITGGMLHNEDRFGLSDALYYRDRTLEQPLDTGAQVGYKGRHFYQEFWISWYLLNTPEHREFFAAGSRTEVDVKNFHAELDVLESHHGGQLYDAGQPVADNVSFQLTAQYFQPFNKYWGIGGSASGLLAISVPDRAQHDLTNIGSGIELSLLWRLYAVDMGFSYYQTLTKNPLIIEMGNTLYRTKEPLWQIWAERAFQIGPSDLVLGARMYIFEETVEYAYSLIWRVGLDGGRFKRYIHRHKERRLAKEAGREVAKEKTQFEKRKAYPFQAAHNQAQRYPVAFSEPVFTPARVTSAELYKEADEESKDAEDSENKVDTKEALEGEEASEAAPSEAAPSEAAATEAAATEAAAPAQEKPAEPEATVIKAEASEAESENGALPAGEKSQNEETEAAAQGNPDA